MATRFNLKCFTIQLNVIAIGLLMNSVITFGYQLQTKNFQKGMDLEICLGMYGHSVLWTIDDSMRRLILQQLVPDFITNLHSITKQTINFN